MAIHLQSWRKSRGLTLQAVAEMIGTDKTQISRLENGKRRLTEDWLTKLAKAYGCEPRDLLGPAETIVRPARQNAFVYLPGQHAAPSGAFPADLGPRDLPVRGLTEGGDGHYAFDPDPIEWCQRPAPLMGVRDAFALYVTGTSMEDVLMEGTLVMVHPSQPPRAMDLVVVERQDGGVLVKRLIRKTDGGILLRRYNPPADFEVPRGDIKAMFRVVATQMP